MKLEVTKAITLNHRYHAVGDIVELDDSQAGSWLRIWPDQFKPYAGRRKATPDEGPSGPSLDGLTKNELANLAAEQGHNVAGLTKAEIRELIES